jgi:LPXTG-motif cell wall-anchored protein
MRRVRTTPKVVTAVLGALLALLLLSGPIAAPAGAQASDPGDCAAASTGYGSCTGGGGGGTAEVLGATAERAPSGGAGSGGGLLPKTGTEIVALVLLGAALTGIGLGVRKAVRRA